MGNKGPETYEGGSYKAALVLKLSFGYVRFVSVVTRKKIVGVLLVDEWFPVG